MAATIDARVLLDDTMPSSDYSFADYLIDYQKVSSYRLLSSHDYASHRRTFEQNRDAVRHHNANPARTWTMAINEFTDLTIMQVRHMNGLNRDMLTSSSMLHNARVATDADLPSIALADLPAAVDWRDLGFVTPVRKQGGCGSCWAFGAAEGVESAVAMATGKLLVLAPQHMVSCTSNPRHCGGKGGCDGAIIDLGFEFATSNGIALEADYPYRAADSVCNTTVHATAKVDGWVKLPENNYTALMIAVATRGPVTVNLDVGPFAGYRSGVSTACRQLNDTWIGHVVQIVGYGHDNVTNLDYWTLRNSWGSGWGNAGYINVERHSDGAINPKKYCTIDTLPSIGTGCDGGPANVTVCGSCGIWYAAAYAYGGHIVPA